MTESELLKPRYKVIADFPGSNYLVNDIIENIGENYCNWLSDFPHLFRKLEWWEERGVKDMPEYVKFYEPLPEKFSIWKVHEWRFGLRHPLIKTDCDIVWRELSIMDLPATKEEYELYNDQK